MAAVTAALVSSAAAEDLVENALGTLKASGVIALSLSKAISDAEQSQPFKGFKADHPDQPYPIDLLRETLATRMQQEAERFLHEQTVLDDQSAAAPSPEA